MSTGDRLTVEQHKQRAAAHLEVANRLLESDEEWAVVPLFYTAYHFVKAAMLADPVFDDPTRLSRFNASLTMEDRYSDIHQGRMAKGQRERWGVKDIVAVLYKPIYASYELLHLASTDVRYGRGLVVGSPSEADEALTRIYEAYERGAIVAP